MKETEKQWNDFRTQLIRDRFDKLIDEGIIKIDEKRLKELHTKLMKEGK